ncbi:hypothetical protein PANO111632_17385 [Paracoccus nototheniae]
MSIEADPVQSPPYPATEDGDISRGPIAGDDIDWPATTVTLPAGSTRSMTPMAQPPVIPPAPPVVPSQPGPTHPQPAADRANDPIADRLVYPDDDPQDTPAPHRQGQPHAAMLTPAPVLRPVQPAPQRADLPAVIPEAAPQPRGGYRAGFLLALVTVLVLAGLSLLAPMDEASPAGGWRADLDQTRLWLQGLFR